MKFPWERAGDSGTLLRMVQGTKIINVDALLHRAILLVSFVDSSQTTFVDSTISSLVDPNAPPKRKSRWGAATTAASGFPTAVSSTGLSVADLDKYAIQVRLEEINRKLRMNDFIPPENERYATI
jgi:hypothetical protein